MRIGQLRAYKPVPFDFLHVNHIALNMAHSLLDSQQLSRNGSRKLYFCRFTAVTSVAVTVTVAVITTAVIVVVIIVPSAAQEYFGLSE